MKTLLKIFFVLPIIFVAALIGFFYRNHVVKRPQPVARVISHKPFATQFIGGVNANFYTAGDQLRSSGNDIVIEFRDTNSALVDVGTVKLEFDLNAPGTLMQKPVRVEHTAAPGQYCTTIQPEIGGHWIAKVSFNGSRGDAEAVFPVMVK